MLPPLYSIDDTGRHIAATRHARAAFVARCQTPPDMLMSREPPAAARLFDATHY